MLEPEREEGKAQLSKNLLGPGKLLPAKVTSISRSKPVSHGYIFSAGKPDEVLIKLLGSVISITFLFFFKSVYNDHLFLIPHRHKTT